jgi:antitoxin component of MazEF toxin-antitoxin module
MPVVKIRRVGNSNVITLPAEFETQGFAAGVAALLETQEDGSLRVTPLPDLNEHIRGLARTTAARRRRALAILEAHDRKGAPPAPARS